MVRQVLFIQGAGAGTHDDWDDKLVASLRRELGEDYAVRYPRMPGEDEPSYPAWKAALTSDFKSLDDGAILVGHSVGGTILLHVLAEQAPPFEPGGLFLLAPPFVGDGGWPSEEMPRISDFSRRLPAGLPVYLYHGAGDDIVPLAHLSLYAHAIPGAVIRTLDGRDHQLNNDLRAVAGDIRSLP